MYLFWLNYSSVYTILFLTVLIIMGLHANSHISTHLSTAYTGQCIAILQRAVQALEKYMFLVRFFGQPETA